MTDITQLDKLYHEAAVRCRDMGVALDAEPCGAIHRWVAQHVKHRPETAFFIVQGIAAAMADLDAQAEGFADQGDRAAAKMRESDAFKRHQAKRIRGVRS